MTTTPPIIPAVPVAVPKPERPVLYIATGFYTDLNGDIRLGWWQSDTAADAYKIAGEEGLSDIQLYRLDPSPQPAEPWQKKAAEWIRQRTRYWDGDDANAASVLMHELDAEAAREQQT